MCKKYEFIKDITRCRRTCRQKLYKVGDEYLVASQVHDIENRISETLIFPSDADGQITNYLEVYGERGWKDIVDVMEGFTETDIEATGQEYV